MTFRDPFRVQIRLNMVWELGPALSLDNGGLAEVL